MLKRGGSTVTDSNGKITNGNTNPKGMHLSRDFELCFLNVTHYTPGTKYIGGI